MYVRFASIVYHSDCYLQNACAKDLLLLIVRKYVLRKNIDPAYSMDIVWYSMVPPNMCAITNALSCDQNINVLATDMVAS